MSSRCKASKESTWDEVTIGEEETESSNWDVAKQAGTPCINLGTILERKSAKESEVTVSQSEASND
jgi:hypothetical protein